MTAPTPAASTLISKENIKVAAETVGVELADGVIQTLCQEVEYRVREITQVRFQFISCLIHARLSLDYEKRALGLFHSS